jgi:hypothetical protein
LSVLLALAAAAAAGCRQSAPPAHADDRIHVDRNGETTTVTIDDQSREPESPLCKRYCERLGACWYAVPDADPMLASKDVFAKCWAEQRNCRTAPTEVMCCGALTSCGDFVHCQAASPDVISDCTHSGGGITTTH